MLRPSHVSIALSRPQMGENIGMAARAMGNFGLQNLRLIAPRDGWPNRKARDASKHAASVVDHAQLFDTTEAALADAAHIFAVTARPRDLRLPVLTPEEAALRCVKARNAGERCVFLFGRESDGLSNSDVSLAHAVVTAPTYPDYPSLNLAQAVSLIGYIVYRAHQDSPTPPAGAISTEPLAAAGKIHAFADAMEDALAEQGYFRTKEKRASVAEHLKTVWMRADLSERDIGMLYGIVRLLKKS